MARIGQMICGGEVLMRRVEIDEFLEAMRAGRVAFDVRTPAEFEEGHILGAKNLALFSNEERAVVGTLYKQEGRRRAIMEGLDFVGPKMRELVERVEATVGPAQKEVLVHCWRGGMRSGSVAWLLETVGYEVTLLSGGYKSFRRWVLAQLEDPPPFRVIGGQTGVGKTEILGALEELGEPVIDLEGLAEHRGSAFGGLLLGEQPTQQQFENRLAMEIWSARRCGQIPWVEDESRLVGRRHLSNAVMERKRTAPVYVVTAPLEVRVRRLVEVYGEAPKEALVDAFERIRKRLGGLRTKQAKQAVEQGDLAEAAALALQYYDKAYARGLAGRAPQMVHPVDVEGDPMTVARRLVELSSG